MNELLAKFLDDYAGMLPELKIELLRMNSRFLNFRRLARKYNVINITYEIDDFDDSRFIVMEGLLPLGEDAELNTMRIFKMCAEMQSEEDTYGKSRLFMIGNPTFVIRKGRNNINFRVDLPFSENSRKILGGGPFFDKFLNVISKEG